MKDRKLQYRFHNPNPPEVTAAHLLRLLIEANVGKVEQAVREATNPPPERPRHRDEGRSV